MEGRTVTEKNVEERLVGTVAWCAERLEERQAEDGSIEDKEAGPRYAQICSCVLLGHLSPRQSRRIRTDGAGWSDE